MKLNTWLFICLCLPLVQCNAPSAHKITLRVAVPASTPGGHARSIAASDFDCVFVNVAATAYSDISTCWRPGTYSKLTKRYPTGTPTVISLEVTPGAQQSIEVLGFKTSTTTPCIGAPPLTASPALYRYAHQTFDLKNGAVLDINADTTAGSTIIPQCSGDPSHTFPYHYPSATYNLLTLITPNTPVRSGLTAFSISPTLPTGLVLDTTTGAISGTPALASLSSPYVVTAHDSTGVVYTSTIDIQVVSSSGFAFTWPVGDVPSDLSAIALDGSQIYIGGIFGGTSPNLYRVNNDGTLDTTFNSALLTGFNNKVSAIGVESDHSIIVGGSFNQFQGSSSGSMVRLDQAGSPTAFYTAAPIPNGLAIGTDDDIYFVTTPTPRYRFYNNSDTSYVSQSITGTTIPSIVVRRPDGKFMIGRQTDGATVSLVLADSNTSTFAVGFSSTLLDSVTDIAFDSNQKALVVAGGDVYRIKTDGSQDSGFTVYTGGQAVGVQHSGKVLVAKSAGGMLRLKTDGSTDSGFTLDGNFTFNSLPCVSPNILKIVVQSDDKFLASGTCSGGIYFLARFNEDGDQDNPSP